MREVRVVRASLDEPSLVVLRRLHRDWRRATSDPLEFHITIEPNDEPAWRDLPGFISANRYAPGRRLPHEIGRIECARLFYPAPDGATPSRHESTTCSGCGAPIVSLFERCSYCTTVNAMGARNVR